jgi:hypothetical protein
VLIRTGESRNTLRKTSFSATLSTKNPTQTDLVSKPSLHGERSPTNYRNHDTGTKCRGFGVKPGNPYGTCSKGLRCSG